MLAMYSIFNHEQKCQAKQSGNYEKYQCKICGKKFPTLSTMRSCYLKCSGRKYDPRQFICTFENCEFRTKNKKHHQNHLNKHKGMPIERNFACDLCGKQYATNYNLSNHINNQESA